MANVSNMLSSHALYGAFLRNSQILLVLGVMMLTQLLPAAAGAQIRLLALGDSLTAGYGLPPDAAFPAQLEAALRRLNLPVQVINAGVSGDTTAGALSRVDWALADRPSHALVALGANDMLRGLSPDAARDNLDRILTRLQSAGVKVMLAGMLAAPNLGEEYGRRFNAIYPDLARKHALPLYPFFLDGVAGQRALNQDDGIHPTRPGVAVIVERITPKIASWLAEKGN